MPCSFCGAPTEGSDGLCKFCKQMKSDSGTEHFKDSNGVTNYKAPTYDAQISGLAPHFYIKFEGRMDRSKNTPAEDMKNIRMSVITGRDPKYKWARKFVGTKSFHRDNIQVIAGIPADTGPITEHGIVIETVEGKNAKGYANNEFYLISNKNTDLGEPYLKKLGWRGIEDYAQQVWDSAPQTKLPEAPPAPKPEQASTELPAEDTSEGWMAPVLAYGYYKDIHYYRLTADMYINANASWKKNDILEVDWAHYDGASADNMTRGSSVCPFGETSIIAEITKAEADKYARHGWKYGEVEPAPPPPPPPQASTELSNEDTDEGWASPIDTTNFSGWISDNKVLVAVLVGVMGIAGYAAATHIMKPKA